MQRARTIPTTNPLRHLAVALPIALAVAVASLLSAGVLFPAEPVLVAKRPTLSSRSQSVASVRANPDCFATSANFTSESGELARTLASAEKEGDSDQQSQIESNLTEWLLAQGVDAAIEQLNEQTGSALLADLKTRFIRELAAANPRQAAAAALRLDEPGRQQALEGALIVWADQNLDDAIAWVGKLPDGAQKDGVERSVAYEAAGTDPQAAVNLVVTQDPSAERDQVLNFAVAQWAASDPKTASAWASQVEAGPLKDQMVASIAVAWAKTDPTAAAALALQSLPDGKDKADAVTGIVQRVTEADPQAAADWITQFPEGPLRNAAEENMVKLWTDQNPDEAGSWLGTLPLTPSRDLAVLAYAQQVSPSQPAIAMQWVESISDTKLRLSAIGSLQTTR